jgi:hypothetical protein
MVRLGVLVSVVLAPSLNTAFAQQGICGGSSMPLDASVQLRPFVHMRLGNREGNFVLDTGSDYSMVDARTYGLSEGSKVKLSGSTFPGMGGGDFSVVDLGHVAAPGGQTSGLIGTDVFRRRTVEFQFDAAPPRIVVSSQCSIRQFEDAGFMSIPQRGHYSFDPRHLGPGLPNIPMILMRIGSVTAPALIDSGSGENPKARRGIVQVNDALFQILRAGGISMQQFGTSPTFDCHGARTEDPLWQVQDAPLILSAREDQPLFQYGAPMLQVRPATTCGSGGLASVRTPIAEIGVIYMARWGTTALDGPNERVWVKQNRASLSSAALYRAMAIAWNKNGAWNVQGSDTVDAANTRALTACNEKNGNCTLAVSVRPSEFMCVALARSLEDPTKLAFSSNSSLKDARDNARKLCASRYGSCRAEFSYCND